MCFPVLRFVSKKGALLLTRSVNEHDILPGITIWIEALNAQFYILYLFEADASLFHFVTLEVLNILEKVIDIGPILILKSKGVIGSKVCINASSS